MTTCSGEFIFSSHQVENEKALNGTYVLSTNMSVVRAVCCVSFPRCVTTRPVTHYTHHEQRQRSMAFTACKASSAHPPLTMVRLSFFSSENSIATTAPIAPHRTHTSLLYCLDRLHTIVCPKWSGNSSHVTDMKHVGHGCRSTER